MKLENGLRLYSATDLVAFLGCEHATALDVDALLGRLAAPRAESDAYLEVLKGKGDEHEKHHLQTLKDEGRSVIEIDRAGSLEARTEATRRAMREGADVIYQGALVSAPDDAARWHGYSDFLYKVAEPSDVGAWSYEVADTKLARSAKPKHVVQLCVYSDLVALVQGRLPANAHLVLGDDSTFSVRVQDYIHYVRAAQERLLSFAGADTRETAAEPCPHCELCGWSDRCEAEWERTEHLSLVAALGRPQAKKLRAAGVTDMRALAELPDERTIPRLQTATLTRLRSQARLQMVKRTTGADKVELLAQEPGYGFARLPRPNEGDLFFDMEGDPVYSAQGGLEYLFGFHHVDDGGERFTPFWARSRGEEKQAFENALDFITARLVKYPDAFVYHYASYETAALKRLALQYGTQPKEQVDALKLLAQQYGTRENEVDDLLRNRKFVDLYKVVRESVRVSEPRYSLKNLETFFAPARTETITSGGDSIVAFERWLVTGEDELLEQIEEYNAFDCRSTRLCRDWLLSLRPKDTPWFDPASEIAAEDAEREKKRRQEDAIILAMRQGLLEKSPAPDDPAEQAWRELLGHLLEYHRREARNEWWDFFKRQRATVEQLVDDSECIGALTVDLGVQPRKDKRSTIWRLRFPDQEFKFTVGDEPVRQDTGDGAGTIVGLNEAEGWLDLRVGPSRPPFPAVVNLIPQGPRDDQVMRMAIARYAMEVIDQRDDEHTAITGLLRRDKPRLADHVILSAEGAKDLKSATVDAVRRMRDTHLVIQGPPGTGKTFTSAHAIVALLDEGKRVGVAAHTHKAINKLLTEVEKVAHERRVAFKGIKKNSEADQRLNGAVIEDTNDNDDIVGGTHQVIGGTAWLFARPDMAGKLDYLFVDEAGQMSLANVVAMSLSARNLVLVGDQMQLSQPTKGAHPGGSACSALEYLMEGRATVPGDRGIFLAKTWRMHPDVCRPVSEAFYESRLESAEPTKQQRLVLTEPHEECLAPTGIRFVPVRHADHRQRSTEEAQRVDR
ncbi:MAG TPA: TM0106 family RecB-like putative nuclease, partial [Gemmatimonadaceae bacterium]|nr:TM0106 family RecB-like putative nuclease [Gemmatimonadaceae bacterium]